MGEKSHRRRKGIVYSTDPDFEYSEGSADQQETLSPDQQDLLVRVERKGRKGKTLTILSGFTGSREDLKDLAKKLKKKCGTGGSEDGADILIQGDFRKKIRDLLSDEGYKVRVSGG